MSLFIVFLQQVIIQCTLHSRTEGTVVKEALEFTFQWGETDSKNTKGAG